MTSCRISRLTETLRRAEGRERIGVALASGLKELTSADAVIVWLAESTDHPLQHSDLFLSGIAGGHDNLPVAADSAGLQAFLDRLGFVRCVFPSCPPHVARIALAWRTVTSDGQASVSLLEPLIVLASTLLELDSLSKQAASTRAALAEAEEQLTRSQRHRANAELASGLVHDFNNCLTTILGLTEIAVDDLPKTDPNYEGLVTVRTVALDAAILVRRLHAVGRHTKNGNQRELADLRDVARSMREITRPRWSRRAELEGLKFEVVVVPGEAPPVHVEVAEIRELLLNLLFNAFDAMPSGGDITVTTSTGAADGWAEVRVRDQGTGMPQEVLAQVFEPFFSTKGERGSGLGLSVCRNIAQRYGGTLTVESTPGVGSTFALRLPPAPASVVAAACDASPSPAGPAVIVRPAVPADTAHRRILLVDDQEDVRRSVGEMLRAMGHDVVTAPDGPAALTTAMHDALDVVITDFGMPGMNGAEVAIRLQSVVPNLPVVMITGWGFDSDTPLPDNVMLALGKPITMKELGDAIVACQRGQPA